MLLVSKELTLLQYARFTPLNHKDPISFQTSFYRRTQPGFSSAITLPALLVGWSFLPPYRSLLLPPVSALGTGYLLGRSVRTMNNEVDNKLVLLGNFSCVQTHILSLPGGCSHAPMVRQQLSGQPFTPILPVFCRPPRFQCCCRLQKRGPLALLQYNGWGERECRAP